MKPLRWTWLGRTSYRSAWELQESIRDRVLGGDDSAEELLLLEHDPVITLGRSADPRNVLVPREALAAAGIDLVPTSRGGDVTAHGPGQLVIYPIVRIPGVVRFVESIGRAIVAELQARGLGDAEWRRDPAGVWLGAAKIAACGVHIKHRVSIHGFALNVTDEPQALFSRIIPCGLSTRVTSIAAHTAPPALPDLAATLAPRICAALDREPARSFSCHHHPDR